jgi:methionyl aminopeptidase
VGRAVQEVAEGAGFSVVREYEGHAIGTAMHEKPGVPNYGPPGRGPALLPGMTLAIEPMINAGGPDVVMHADEWSISSADGSLSAHYEHTVAVMPDAPRVLTAAKTPAKAGLLP